MSIYKDKSPQGETRYIVEVYRNSKRYRLSKDPETGKAIKKKSRAYELEIEFREKVYSDIGEKTGSRHKIGALYELYQVQLNNKLKPTTVYLRVHTLQSHFIPQFKNRDVESMTNEDLEFFNDALNKKLSSGAMKNAIGGIRGFIKFLRKYNPLLLPELIYKYQDSTPRIHKYNFYTLEQENEFLSVIDNDRDKLMFALFCCYGFRLTECLALKRGDIDLSGKTISIHRIMATKTLMKGQTFQTPKTKRSIRTLPLVPEIAAMIDPSLGFDDFLFPSKKPGSFVEGEISVRRKVKKYADLAGLPVIKVHEFRHSCASNLIREGKPLRVVANWIGDTETTVLSYYSHMFNDEATTVPSVFSSQLTNLASIKNSQKSPHD